MTLNFISDITTLSDGLNIIYSRWPPLKSTMFAYFRESSEKVSLFFFYNTIYIHMFESLILEKDLLLAIIKSSSMTAKVAVINYKYV